MTRFEEYLLDQGFKRMVRLHSGEFLEGKKASYSSLENVIYWYLKNERRIIFGLNERHKPPTLIYPRPRIKSKEVPSWSDDAMNRVLGKYEPEEILKAIYDESIIFEV